MEIKNKKISIIGAVRSGIGAAKLVKNNGGIPFVSDASDNDKLRKSVKTLDELNIKYELGGHSDEVFDCDLMVASPGVPINSEILKKAISKNIKLISEIELASYFCKGKIIAITGTNGKTTTTALIAHLINSCGKKAYEAGNIGKAFSEVVEQVKEDEYVSLETSSFQLDLIETLKPVISLILNITPDHLNRYDNKYDNYINSKLRIFMNQDEDDTLVLNYDDSTISKLGFNNKSKTIYFSTASSTMRDGFSLLNDYMIFMTGGKELFRFNINSLRIKGEHNIQNAMAAASAALLLGMPNEGIEAGLKSFKGVEHRLEFVREIDGVKFVNDSKATNIDSVWYALRSFDDPILLILGGLDVGNDYNKIKDLVLKKVKKIYAIGTSATKIFNFFHNDVKVEIKKSLEEAVNSANLEARNEEIVLLSPACKSFDMFDSYEHRGQVFKDAVNKL